GHYRPAFKNGPTAGLFPSVAGANGHAGEAWHGHANEHVLPGLNATATAPAPPAVAAKKMPLPLPPAVSIRNVEAAPTAATPSTPVRPGQRRRRSPPPGPPPPRAQRPPPPERVGRTSLRLKHPLPPAPSAQRRGGRGGGVGKLPPRRPDASGVLLSPLQHS